MTTTTTITTECGVKVGAMLVADHVLVYPLTACCGAAATGGSITDYYPDGIACKGCYEPVPAYHGIDGWAAVVEAVIEGGCPCPSECADHTIHAAAVELGA